MAKNKDIFIDIKDHGFRPEDIVPEDHYVLGGYSKLGDAPVILPSGDWTPFKAVNELQNKNGLETFNCSNYGTNQALAALAKFHGFPGFPLNCSERYTGVLTGTTDGGNSPHKVIELIRTEVGEIPEEDLPFDASIDLWEEYYSPNPMDPALAAKGKALLERFAIGHEWVFLLTGTPEQKHAQLELALTKGSVCVSVLAWKSRDGLYFKEVGEGDNHWVQLLRRNKSGTWTVFDHYDKFEKELEAGYDFGFAKVYYLSQKAAVQKKSPLTQFVDALVEAFVAIIKKLIGKK